MRSLLEEYTLINVEFTKLSGELHRTVSANEHCQARIELKLSPQQPTPESGQNLAPFVLQAKLAVLGLPPNGRESDKLFSLELAANALYQPILNQHGHAIGDPQFSAFNARHTDLTRQVFPILERRAHLLLLELGIGHIRLPMDLVHLAQEEPPAGQARPAYH
jgi:hypothetical protein